MSVWNRIDQLYSRLPKINCRKLCQESCGPILMTKPEWDRVLKKMGLKTDAKLPLNPDLTCPMLKNGLCSVYTVRPLICRLFGLVEKMRCPHGCRPERWLSDSEAEDFLRALDQIGAGYENKVAFHVPPVSRPNNTH